MANKLDYIAALRAAISRQHRCGSIYLKTEHVHETSEGSTVWAGEVEVFNLMHHPEARRAYAWAHQGRERSDETRLVVVLELPPVKDAKTAVLTALMSDSKIPQP